MDFPVCNHTLGVTGNNIGYVSGILDGGIPFEAEKLAWQQIDHIRHSGGYYILDDYVHFKYKGKEIVDPWINAETHYNATAWVQHDAPEQAVDPFIYYGKEKAALFIEKILMLHDR